MAVCRIDGQTGTAIAAATHEHRIELRSAAPAQAIEPHALIRLAAHRIRDNHLIARHIERHAKRLAAGEQREKRLEQVSGTIHRRDAVNVAQTDIDAIEVRVHSHAPGAGANANRRQQRVVDAVNHGQAPIAMQRHIHAVGDWIDGNPAWFTIWRH